MMKSVTCIRCHWHRRQQDLRPKSVINWTKNTRRSETDQVRCIVAQYIPQGGVHCALHSQASSFQNKLGQCVTVPTEPNEHILRRGCRRVWHQILKDQPAKPNRARATWKFPTMISASLRRIQSFAPSATIKYDPRALSLNKRTITYEIRTSHCRKLFQFDRTVRSRPISLPVWDVVAYGRKYDLHLR